MLKSIALIYYPYQAECEELQARVENLSNENRNLRDELQRLSEECEKLRSENDSIKVYLSLHLLFWNSIFLLHSVSSAYNTCIFIILI